MLCAAVPDLRKVLTRSKVAWARASRAEASASAERDQRVVELDQHGTGRNAVALVETYLRDAPAGFGGDLHRFIGKEIADRGNVVAERLDRRRGNLDRRFGYARRPAGCLGGGACARGDAGPQLLPLPGALQIVAAARENRENHNKNKEFTHG